MTGLRPVPAPEPGDERSCPAGVCDGSGWIELEDNTAAPCECRKDRIARAAGRGMGTGVPKKFRGVSFDRRPIVDLNPDVLRRVRGFINEIETNIDAGKGLWFGGDIGTGKTSLAMLVVLAAEQANRSTLVYPITRLLAEIRDTYNNEHGASYMQLFRRITEVDLLLIDDLGTEKQSDWVLEQLYSIVNERWQDERSIIVTSNTIELGELREQLGWRTVSRIVEMCDDPLQLRGDDLRMRAG